MITLNINDQRCGKIVFTKYSKKNTEIGGEKTGKGGGKKIMLQKKTEIRAEKGQTKKVNLG
jgi:hypothetical protein